MLCDICRFILTSASVQCSAVQAKGGYVHVSSILFFHQTFKFYFLSHNVFIIFIDCSALYFSMLLLIIIHVKHTHTQ